MRLIVALVLAFILVVQPARADGERTLVDLTVETVPHRNDGHCFQAAAGHITATIQTVGSGAWPVRYNLGPWGNAAEGERVNTLIATQPTAYSIVVQDGLYCYALSNEAVPPTQRLYPDEVYRYAQNVTIQMIWAP